MKKEDLTVQGTAEEKSFVDMRESPARGIWKSPK